MTDPTPDSDPVDPTPNPVPDPGTLGELVNETFVDLGAGSRDNMGRIFAPPIPLEQMNPPNVDGPTNQNEQQGAPTTDEAT